MKSRRQKIEKILIFPCKNIGFFEMEVAALLKKSAGILDIN